MSRWWWPSVAICGLSLGIATSPAAYRFGRGVATSIRQRSQATPNPKRLRAVQLLERRARGAAARVRFEWDQVTGVREYLLAGEWVTPPSWAISKRQYRVNARNAALWNAQQVAFEASIPEGSHSWRVASRVATDSAGAAGNGTALTFDLR